MLVVGHGRECIGFGEVAGSVREHTAGHGSVAGVLDVVCGWGD